MKNLFWMCAFQIGICSTCALESIVGHGFAIGALTLVKWHIRSRVLLHAMTLHKLAVILDGIWGNYTTNITIRALLSFDHVNIQPPLALKMTPLHKS